MFLPVSRLSLVLAAQWAGEALTLFTLEHQLQSSDEPSWLTLLAGPLLITTRFGLSPVKLKSNLLIMFPIFALFCTCTLCTLSLSGCVVLRGIAGRSLQLPIARSEGQDILGLFGGY